MIKFLGSIYFAVFLIVCTLVFVIAGTLVESTTQSHLFAEGLTYRNPIFQLLLWFYFVNILFAALNRYPFKRKHIPFLLTHLGLLLLLLGVFVKNHFGIQGSLAIIEGSGSSLLFLPNTYALHIENPQGCTQIKLKEKKLGPITRNQEGLELTLLEWTPHALEHIEGFIKGNWVHILSLPPFQLQEFGSTHTLETPEYQIHAYHHCDAWENILFPGKPSLFFIQDHDRKQHLLAFNEKGERFSQPLEKDTIYVYNKGYGGYATCAELPKHFPQIELVAPLTRTWERASLPIKKEEAIPRIRLLASLGSISEIVTLSYDKYGQQFKWPILGGRYLIRFQSAMKKIPFHVRLRQALQVNYPGTSQPFSYSALALIDGEEEELSMNHIYEKRGYRFYLSHLLARLSGANHVHIIVNYDPAKYYLTYPGAIILAVGIFLLYLQKRYV